MLIEGKRVCDHIEESDRLLAACRVVGAASGITIRPYPATSAAPTSTDPLSAIARASRIRTRRVILSGDWWHRDNGPLLVYHEASQQPLALLPRSPRSYELVDPATGARTPVTAEVAAALNSFAVQFYRPLAERSLGGWNLLRFALFGTRNDLRMLAIMGTASGLLALAAPLATEYIFSTILPAGQRGQLLQLGLALGAGALAASTFEITRNIALLRLEGRVDATLQAAVWDRLLSLPASFFRAYAAGDLGDRAMGVSAVRQTLSETAVTSMLAAVFSVFSLGLLFYYDLALALLALGMVAIFAVVTGLASMIQIRRQRALSELQGYISGLVLQFILAIAKLRVAGAERRAFTRWAEQFSIQKQRTAQAETVGNIMAVWHAAFSILVTMGIFAAMLSGGSARLPTGTFLAFTAALTQLAFAMVTLGTTLTQVTSVVPLYERARPILQTPPEVDEIQRHPGELAGAIAVEHVSFRYRPDERLTLDNVSLHIQPGEYVALVGPSGSGKSTLLRLLLGFERPELGAISYDGQNLATLDVREVRRQLGVVLQNSALMTDDIFHNIIGSSLLTIEDAWAAARLVGLAEDIQQMPMEMHTVVSEGAGTFSGGQRQRILLARALVQGPRILFLDEATSALDNVTQAVVAESLARIKATRVIIAHRLSTIMQADRIYVLASGAIVQSGTYAELMQQPGVFADLAQRQLV